jgi:hypothetical protein
VARLGIQAAGALDHAHQMGIVHRDVKPANLLVDAAGQLWITDFGLAHVQSNTQLTMTGDLVGTLRYMSPEQALAKRAVVDHRTDIYSLGATLYELLTLEPAFAGSDRHELLRQIAFEEPAAPRRLNRAIPVELETIVMKAMEKNPAERYSTAKELAEDLERFLKDEPIRAKRPAPLHRARKWGRRHAAAVRATVAAAVVVLLAVTGAIGWGVRNRTALEQEVARDREIRQIQTETDTTSLLDDVERQRAEIHAKLADPIKVCELLSKIDGWRETLAKARAAWKSGKNLAASNDDVLTAELAKRLQIVDQELEADEADWKVAKTLDDIRLEADALVDGKWNLKAAIQKYEQLFRDLGFDWKASTSDQIASKIQQGRLRYVLVGALDDWGSKSVHRPQQLETARLADPDSWRDQLREEKNWSDLRTLEKLAREVDPGIQSPHILALLAGRLATQKADGSILFRFCTNVLPAGFLASLQTRNLPAKPRPKDRLFPGCPGAAPEKQLGA